MITKKQLESNANRFQLLGMSIITLSVFQALIPQLDYIPLEYSVGGIGIGSLIGWVIPFWLRKAGSNKKFVKYF